MAGARHPILMPKLGLTMTEGMLAEWKVAPGDRVAAGDMLFVVETDKISNEIEASADGVIVELYAAAGDVVLVGEPVAAMLCDGAAGHADPPPLAPAPRLLATPLARRVAGQAGIALSLVAGSGPRGRITADDVIALIDATPHAPDAVTPTAAPGADPIIPLTSYQAVAARRLTQAKQDIPHFYLFAEADVTALRDARAQLNADTRHIKLSVSHFLLAAVARALVAVPAVNRVWTDEGLRQLAQADVGLAVDSAKGLVAPLLPDLGAATLDEIAASATSLVERARAGRLLAQDLRGGATTISNLGMFGITGVLPIINPGQSSILGVGADQPQFRPDVAGQPVLRRMLGLTLSCDHRVIDGAIAAQFLRRVQSALEAPLSLLRRESFKT
jgi:pyruvate dehydrogenase E2 component (dihydrolipoamide acetyltransferase)